MPDSDLDQARAVYKRGNFPAAYECAQRVIARDPNNADALNIAGISAANLGRRDEAIDLLKKTVSLKPRYIRSQSNLALMLADRGDAIAAEAHARLAIREAPGNPLGHFALGRVLRYAKQENRAIDSLQAALRLDANYVEAHYELALAFDAVQRFDQTEAHLKRVLELRPDNLAAYSALAVVRLHEGRADDAIATYRAGQRAAPNNAAFAGLLLLVGMYHADVTAEQLFEETTAWNAKFALPLAAEISPRQNSRDPSRVLRIGYVSPNFREHSVAFFFEPVLEKHDRTQFKIILYHDSKVSDAFTERMRSGGDEWRDIGGKDDLSVCEMIRSDEIDILVDLSQHLDSNRLLAFARKPAPVQVSYLGYPATTGLTAIDYRLSDRYLDPPDAPPVPGSEEIARLPQSYFCYRPPDLAPDVVEPPVLRNGFITFAAHHALLKLNDRCLQTWANLLREVPRSKLQIKALGCASEGARSRIRRSFESAGVEGDRVIFRGFTPLAQALSELNQADIALDSFPYSGGTTTCHMLWMGLPVISLAGELPFQRMGLSVLAQVGLQDLVANSSDQYVQIAATLAGDVDRLRDLRTTMRDRMKGSPLMQADQFDRGLENIYRDIWRRYCSTR